MGECIIASRGKGGPQSYPAQSVNLPGGFDGPVSLTLNCDWTTIGTISQSANYITAIIANGYSNSPNTIVLLNISQEISITLGNTRQGTMYGRLIKSGNSVLLQAKQTSGELPLNLSFTWAIGN